MKSTKRGRNETDARETTKRIKQIGERYLKTAEYEEWSEKDSLEKSNVSFLGRDAAA